MWAYRTMARRPRSYEEEEWWSEEPRSIVVHEPVDEPIDTGLVDLNGTPLYRVRQRAPIGFIKN